MPGYGSGMMENMGGFDPRDLMAAPAIRQEQTRNQADMVSAPYEQANRMAAFEPIERLARFGQGLTGVGGMLGSVQTTTGPAAPTPSPLAGALQAGIGAFTLGKLFG